MKVGDLVKMRIGYSQPGLVLEMTNNLSTGRTWVKVLWPDYGAGLEKDRDLVVMNESR